MSLHLNTPFDNDLDAFLNYDQQDQTPMSSSSDVKPTPALLHQSSSIFTSNSDAFSGPSYQYDSHRQQTGMPMGGYANTLAVNQATGLHYRPSTHGFVVPTETLNIPLSNLDEFDFSRPPMYDMSEMDMESDSPVHALQGSSMSPSSQIPPRIYPGMHTQQANMQKIQQIQRLQQQPKQVPNGQQPLPTSTPKSPAVKDPHVEESISRLLNRMRQSSNASIDEDAETPGMSNMPRIKKDEDEMDDDERLLNSEEGKKLSSKERRQLRNKVSARAFRSRRKEYIGQLEGEVAAKAQEANELRIQNRQLMEENTRLTDLTRMLLSSASFSNFLSELSQGGVQAVGPQASQSRHQQQNQQQNAPQPQGQRMRKDVSSHEANHHVQNQNQNHHMQVGMTLIPETPIDMSVFDNHTNWNNVVPSNDYQVFSMSELPEPPKLDLSSLTEKSVSSGSVTKPCKVTKQDAPVIPSLPTSPVVIESAGSDLYADDQPILTNLSLPTSLYTTLSKASVSSQILSAHSPSSTSSWADLETLCQEMDAMGQLISQYLP